MSTYDLLGPGTANDEEDAMDADMEGGGDEGEEEEEEEGNVDLMGDNTGDEDSSEEGTEGSEEEREVRAGKCARILVWRLRREGSLLPDS